MKKKKLKKKIVALVIENNRLKNDNDDFTRDILRKIHDEMVKHGVNMEITYEPPPIIRENASDEEKASIHDRIMDLPIKIELDFSSHDEWVLERQKNESNT